MFFFFFSKPYISVVGEIADDKYTYDKARVHASLQNALDEVNRKHEADISAKFMPTIGNEFQGLICKGANLMQIILEIKNRMYPVKLRFGIGIGELETEFNSEMSITVSGPGYEKARESLEHLRLNAGRKQTPVADVYALAVGEHAERMRLVNTILSLLTTLEYAWSGRQREIIRDMMEHRDRQSGTAKRLGITQPTVQKSLTAARYYTYEEGLKTLETVFSEIGDHNEQ